MSHTLSSQREGYWYAYPAMASELEKEGAVVKRVKAEPPWLIVDQSLGSVIVTARHWPGQLWKARVETLGDMSGLVARPGYWRASSIELIEEIPVSALFGPHGDAIVALLAQVSALSPKQAEALQSNAAPHAWEAYSRAWTHWSETRKHPRSGSSENWRGVLAAPHGNDKEKSPINGGFALISDLVRRRAQALEGHDAFTLESDDDGESEEVLTPKWSGASAAFLQAAMALGAPAHVMTAIDRDALTHAWRRVFDRLD